MEDKSSLYLVAIVGIVAIVALVMMITFTGTKALVVPTSVETGNMAGNAMVPHFIYEQVVEVLDSSACNCIDENGDYVDGYTNQLGTWDRGCPNGGTMECVFVDQTRA